MTKIFEGEVAVGVPLEAKSFTEWWERWWGKKKKKEAWKARYSTVLCTGSLDWHLSGLASYLKLANTSVIQQSEKKEHQEWQREVLRETCCFSPCNGDRTAMSKGQYGSLSLPVNNSNLFHSEVHHIFVVSIKRTKYLPHRFPIRVQ